MSRLKEKFEKEAIPALMKKFHYKNIMQVPRLEKVVVNVGVSSSNKDSKIFDIIEDNIKRIFGQKPIQTKAKVSISNFKTRAGQAVGVKATLRGKRMYDFVDKLVNVALARIRDFRGVSLTSIDKNGNLNIGLSEHIVFPEIKSDEVERIHGIEVTMVSTAKNKEEGKELFTLLGFPFQK